MIFMNLGCTKG